VSRYYAVLHRPSGKKISEEWIVIYVKGSGSGRGLILDTVPASPLKHLGKQENSARTLRVTAGLELVISQIPVTCITIWAQWLLYVPHDLTY
jgi:hypothetical protein